MTVGILLVKAAKVPKQPNIYEQISVSLVLMGNQLTDVRGLGKLTKLTILILNGNRLAQLPKGLANLKQLEYLDLRLNEITDVSDLKKLLTLTELQLGDNPDLTKAQIDHLKKSLPKCRINSNSTN